MEWFDYFPDTLPAQLYVDGQQVYIPVVVRFADGSEEEERRRYSGRAPGSEEGGVYGAGSL